MECHQCQAYDMRCLGKCTNLPERVVTGLDGGGGTLTMGLTSRVAVGAMNVAELKKRWFQLVNRYGSTATHHADVECFL